MTTAYAAVSGGGIYNEHPNDPRLIEVSCFSLPAGILATAPMICDCALQR
jgi:hypothetical protein